MEKKIGIQKYMELLKLHSDDRDLGKALCSLHSGKCFLDEIMMLKTPKTVQAKKANTTKTLNVNIHQNQFNFRVDKNTLK